MLIRNILSSDYYSIITVVNDWWGGRQMADLLPRLFFDHFQETSFAIEKDDTIMAFLIGFCSQSQPGEAYIHFVGVHPDHRQHGLGKQLYRLFFEKVKEQGCHTVRCITSPVNTGSIAYHMKMGFRIETGDMTVNGVSVHKDYDGAGKDRILFVKRI